ncbi:hypothetical protein TEA_010946 [Camellia sinensis var. sinensis]|uniref:FAD-binding domain-containing protein n=2 Tax=Camellia sinensis TaxID=4442 RepID=A0A4S4E719_CAMSN|nr:hypothetical protein TEA_010946 [Camellia sinensis var. sinensis]
MGVWTFKRDALVLIGCDGANSVVVDFLELKPPKAFPLSAVRGLTKYPSGHAFAHEFVRMRRNNIMVGRVPIDDKSVNWMVGQQTTPKGTVIVAGDAMHVMGPFLGQGGSAGLEDAIVLARCLYQKLSDVRQIQSRSQMMMHKVAEAMDQYVKERRMRVVRLSMQTYLTGLLVGPSSMLVLIGCDGANSVVADFLELKAPKAFPLSAVRGLTKYPSGHAFAHEFVRMRRNNIMVGRVPIDDKSVNWMVGQQSTPKDARTLQNPDLIIQSTLPLIYGFPPEIQQMIEDSDVESLSLTHVRYRAPWDLLLGKFRKGTVTVAGDAMHVMGPFLGQGGSAGLEDAIVLARCLYQKLSEVRQIQSRSQMMMHKVAEAMDQYVKERRMRVVRLSMQTYLTGLLVGPSSMLVKLASIVLMVIFFRNQNDHTTYDCGLL